MMTRFRAWIVLPLTIVALAAVMGACGEKESATAPAGVAATPTTAATASGGVAINGAWARAAVGPMAAGSPSADMSASPCPGMGTCMAGGAGTPMMGNGMGMGGAGTNSAAFMVIQNNGDTEQRLVSAASDVAAVVEIHETTMVDGTMRMRPVEGGVVIPAHGSVELKPRDLHIMLIGLHQALNAGDTIALTLTFESGLTVELDAVEVRQP